jgi:hypothetical protein
MAVWADGSNVLRVLSPGGDGDEALGIFQEET